MPAPPPVTFWKAADESRLFDVDLGNYSEFTDSPAETIASAVIPATPAGLTLAAVAFSGTRAQFLTSGGTRGTSYPFEIKVTTAPSGFVLAPQVVMTVY